jgi:hypothetical protein
MKYLKSGPGLEIFSLFFDRFGDFLDKVTHN